MSDTSRGADERFPWEEPPPKLRTEPSATIRLALERSQHDRWIATEREWVSVADWAYHQGAWQRLGTLVPEPEPGEEPFWGVVRPWRAATYCPALGQTVTSDDALDLSHAIHRILYCRDMAEAQATWVGGAPLLPAWLAESNWPVDEETLRALALFLARGAFRVVPVDDIFGEQTGW